MLTNGVDKKPKIMYNFAFNCPTCSLTPRVINRGKLERKGMKLKQSVPQNEEITFAKLAEEGRMMVGLTAVDDHPELKGDFYPLLLELAGLTLLVPDAALILATAIEQYSKGREPIRQRLFASAGKYLSAMVEDPKAAAEAAACIKSVVQ